MVSLFSAVIGQYVELLCVELANCSSAHQDESGHTDPYDSLTLKR